MSRALVRRPWLSGAVGAVSVVALVTVLEVSSTTEPAGPAGALDFFHMDALSSAVATKVNCDLHLTLMGSSLYRLFGARIGGPYATAESRHICRDFVDASATVTITPEAVEVRFGKRAHNPHLLDAGFAETDVSVPWWGGRRLRLGSG